MSPSLGAAAKLGSLVVGVVVEWALWGPMLDALVLCAVATVS